MSALKTGLWVAASAVVLVAIAAPKFLLHDSANAAVTKEPRSGGAGAKRKNGESGPLRVATFVVQAAPFIETIDSTGTLRAEEAVDLQAETNGKIVAIEFEEGKHVRQGELLVKLNDADLRATLARATSTRELAKLKERRYSQLVAQRVITQTDYDTAVSDLSVQEANVDLYRAQIEKTEIRAPFDGVVGLRYVSVGAYVGASTRIATLQRVEKLKVDFAIPEKYAGRVHVGEPIAFTVAGGAGKFQGKLYAVDPRIDTATRTLVLRAACANPNGQLLPGAFANIELELARIDDALLIPAEAVVPGLEEKVVFVLRDGKAERRAVETGTRTTSTVHILAGISAGEVVITSGLQQLRPGQAVAAVARMDRS